MQAYILKRVLLFIPTALLVATMVFIILRQRGQRIGRPRISDGYRTRPDFILAEQRIRAGELSVRRAAQKLGMGYNTLKRLLSLKESMAPLNKIARQLTLTFSLDNNMTGPPLQKGGSLCSRRRSSKSGVSKGLPFGIANSVQPI